MPLSPWITFELFTARTLCPTWSSWRWLAIGWLSINTWLVYPKGAQPSPLQAVTCRHGLPSEGSTGEEGPVLKALRGWPPQGT
ncbi:hypothetical protein Adi01nite_06340 [Amorphoplanes digitatis]|nr:hypothetical protein Adi01nite_06340 [Actinoplanes digitatis]